MKLYSALVMASDALSWAEWSLRRSENLSTSVMHNRLVWACANADRANVEAEARKTCVLVEECLVELGIQVNGHVSRDTVKTYLSSLRRTVNYHKERAKVLGH